MSYYRSAPPPRGFGGGGLALPPFTPAIRGIVVACAAVYLVEVVTYLASGRTAWFLRTFGHNIQGMKHTNVDEIIQILDATGKSDAPLIINANDKEDGEHVQVYIG